MSTLKNLSNIYVPVREQRTTGVSILAALNAEVVLQLSGDESVCVYVNGSAGTLNCTLEFTGTVDGTNYFPVPVIPYYGTGAANTPSFAQPLLSEAINTTAVQRVYCARTAQLKAFRVRMSAYTAGSADVTINSDAQKSLHPAVFDGRPTTLFVGVTGTAGAAATATLPAVAGLRHFIDFIAVQRIATATLVAGTAAVGASAATNLPAGLVGSFAFGPDAAAQGSMVEIKRDFGSTGLAATAPGTATVLTMPATTTVIWRIDIAYRLGI